MKMNFDINDLNVWIKKLTHPQASNDLMKFLQDLPNMVGTTVLAIGGVAWGVALFSMMYSSVQSQQVAELRGEILSTQGLTPPVPRIVNVSVAKSELEAFVDIASKQYQKTGVTFSVANDKIQIKADSGRQFGAFREAVGHIQNGGTGWQVSVDTLCVGRECKSQRESSNAFLFGLFGVSRVQVEMPQL